MELDARKLRILQAVIDEYILSALPVGSRSISRNPEFNLSSATIRNEMADLEEMGFLEQPHTSAGRIPSDKGYRLYVDSIMNRAQLSRDEIKSIRSYFSNRVSEIDEVLKQTARALSSITHYTAMVLPPAVENDTLRHVQLVPLMPGKALLVVVTSTGFAKDAVVRISPQVSSDDLERISRMITDRLYGSRMDQVGEKIRSELTGDLFGRQDFLNELTETISRRIVSDSHSVELAGTGNILHYPEYSDITKVQSFLSAVEGRESLYGLLKKASAMEFTITIGSENEAEQLKDCSVVTATYRMGDQPMGSIGIIGPTRMNYSRVISVLEYMRKGLSEILTSYIGEGE